MKNWKVLLFSLTVLSVTMSSCTWVKPNYAGVLMENYGKAGKEDFTLVSGKQNTLAPGTELIQVPLWEQRGRVDSVMHLKDALNTEFTVSPTYSYRVIKERAIDVVFDNNHFGGAEDGEEFLETIENNVLEMRIRDILKEESRKYTTDTLMGISGSLHFEERTQKIIKEAFEKAGFELISFSSQLDFNKLVKDKINERNQVQQELQVVDQQLEVQKKKIELAKLKAQESIELSKGITQEILQQKAIEGWIEKGCPTPSVIGAGTGIYLPTVPGVKAGR